MKTNRVALLKHAKTSGGKDRVLAAVKLAESDPEVVTSLCEFDSDPWLFGVQNGYINLREGSFHEPDRQQLITNSGNVTYQPKAECPQWEAFLEQILPDIEVKGFIQRAVGYGLTGLISEQCFFLLYGLGANGKSTLLNIVMELFGSYASPVPAHVFMAGDKSHPEAIARLAGKRLVTSSEVDEGNRFSESLIKQFTGGDPVVARHMFGSSFEFVPQFKLFIAGNSKPEIHGMDHGIWRRVRLIPFTTQIPKDAIDREFEDKLRPELSGILNWAIRGCLLWQKGGLQEPDGIKVATKEYQSESNTVGKWIEERCSVEPAAATLQKKLYYNYKQWAEAGGEPALSGTMFGRKLEANGFGKIEPKTNQGYKIGGIALVG